MLDFKAKMIEEKERLANLEKEALATATKQKITAKILPIRK